MKVIKKCESDVTLFKDIQCGDTFYDAKDTDKEFLLMKAILCGDIDFSTEDDQEANCVCLEDGYLYHYRDNEEVIPVRAKVVIE